MKFIRIALALVLSGCDDLYSLVVGPTVQEQARSCGASVEQLKATKERVRHDRPYGGADIGRCSVIKDDSGVVVVSFKGKEIALEERESR